MSRLGIRTLLTDQVFAAIHEQIMNGGMPPGHRLRIRDIAADLGTSVMPVREAIRRLEEAGLVLNVPHRGAVVRGFSLEEVHQVYHVRTLLEVEAARLGAGRVTDADIAAMEMHCTAMVAAVVANDMLAAIEADEALLMILYVAGGNQVLVDTIRSLWEPCRMYKVVGSRKAVADNDNRMWSFQPRLIEAARAHDAGSAAAITEESMISSTARLERQLTGDVTDADSKNSCA